MTNVKIPSIRELLRLNNAINRRLKVAKSRESGKFFFFDADDKEIKADMIGLPWAFEYPCNQNVKDWRLAYRDRPYHLEHDDLGGYLTYHELNLALGKDCRFNSCWDDLQAMCEIAPSGPGLANAYVLGNKNYGMGKPGNAIIGVQFYRISNKDYERLSIKDSPIRDNIIKDISIERKQPLDNVI